MKFLAIFAALALVTSDRVTYYLQFQYFDFGAPGTIVNTDFMREENFKSETYWISDISGDVKPKHTYYLDNGGLSAVEGTSHGKAWWANVLGVEDSRTAPLFQFTDYNHLTADSHHFGRNTDGYLTYYGSRKFDLCNDVLHIHNFKHNLICQPIYVYLPAVGKSLEV
ncbi:hypothetical protein NEOLI_004654 [Neolecta irregularis DAH-3]|uniref:Uncharacterized protein n=1 Tax=Neolecta irregularis (strain DAH-3) TaxID=1198029 RepID=A0A1U7LRI0_NEOID|nr:hypothetical protein NEOLI_004654 [Neolecta irregularis DAH-3]|eukprot:OLL25280.1 hypothetical protein NEOLI_004654 [Neolecta irregularis DAH-3]